MRVEEPPHAELMRSAIRAASEVLRLLENLARDDKPIHGPYSPDVSILCGNGSEGLIKTMSIQKYTLTAARESGEETVERGRRKCRLL